MSDRDYYAELGVGRNATDDELGHAFRRLAAKYHPDRNPGDKQAEARQAHPWPERRLWRLVRHRASIAPSCNLTTYLNIVL